MLEIVIVAVISFVTVPLAGVDKLAFLVAVYVYCFLIRLVSLTNLDGIGETVIHHSIW